MLRSLLGIQKTLFLNFQLSRFRSKTQSSFFRDKNLGSLHVSFFEFLQLPKVSLIIILTIEIWKITLFLPYVRDISLKQRHHAFL